MVATSTSTSTSTTNTTVTNTKTRSKRKKNSSGRKKSKSVSPSMQRALVLQEHIRKTVQPSYRDGDEPEDHAIAKHRIYNILRDKGYYAQMEKPLWCAIIGEFDDNSIEERRGDIIQYEVDIYAECLGLGFIRKMIVEIGGFGTYHDANARSKMKDKQKKERICRLHGIRPEDYYILDKRTIYTKDRKDADYIMTDAQIAKLLKLR